MKTIIIGFGLIFILMGVYTIKRKRHGNEEGLRTPVPIKGKSAIAIGIIFTVFGIALVMAGLMQK